MKDLAISSTPDPQRLLRVVVAGLGFGAAVHLPAWLAQPRVEVIGVASRRLGKAQETAQAHRVALATQSIEELLALSPDIVSIALPPDVAARTAALALGRGISVLSEKPVAATLAEAEALVLASDGLTTGVNFSFSELDTFLELKRRLLSGDLGRAMRTEVAWRTESYAHRHRIWGWKTDRRRFGGVLSSHASHVVHLAEWLFGPAQAVDATLKEQATKAFTPPGELAAWDEATVTLHHGNQLVCRASLANAAPGVDVHDWTIHCEGGWFVLSKHGPGIMTGFKLHRFVGSEAPALIACETHRDASGGRVLPFCRLLDRYVDAVRVGARCSPNFDQGRRAQYLLDRIEASAASATRVGCNEDV